MGLGRVGRFLAERYERRPRAYCLAVTAIVLLVDYVAGKPFQFPILYVVPVAMAAWNESSVLAYALSLLLPLARIGFHFPWGETRSLGFAIFNGATRIVALSLYAYLILAAARHTRELRRRVTVLEGTLPICASCKKIRGEGGEYVEIETYITQHSQASFTHGLCKACAKALYPDHTS